jgi:hypothetical protein
MKKLLLLLPVVALYGCATAPYQAVATTQVAATTAVQEYDAWVKAQPGPQNITQNQKVAALFAKYQQDMEVVCDAGAIYQAAVTSTNSVALATLDQAEANAASDLTDLDNFIISLGVKLQ